MSLAEVCEELLEVMRSRLILFCYVEIDLFVVEMFFQDLFDIVFAIKDCDSHVFVSFYNDELVMVSELSKGKVLKTDFFDAVWFQHKSCLQICPWHVRSLGWLWEDPKMG